MFNKDTLFGKKEDTMRRDMKPGGRTYPYAPGQNSSQNTASTAKQQPIIAKADPIMEDTRPTPVPAKSAEKKESKLIVGPDIKLKGVEITDCDTLVVEGRVEATMDSRVIQVAESGVFSGTVGVDVAEIHGRFEGELTARKRLVIHATGRVSGKIRYGKIAIEEGAELSGDVGGIDSTAQTVPAASAIN